MLCIKQEMRLPQHFSASKSTINANMLRLCVFPRLCFFQDFCKRRSVWKHISHSNDTEALAVDAFKKQCYMKVNRAIKWFLKRQCGTREVPAALWAELVPRHGSGARLGLLCRKIMVFIYFEESDEKTKKKKKKKKLAEFKKKKKRGVTRQNSRGGPLSGHKSC